MSGKVNDGDLCEVVPITKEETIRRDDVVLCRVRGAQYLHLVKAVKGDRYLIGNNKGGTNGWVGRDAVFGRLASVAP